MCTAQRRRRGADPSRGAADPRGLRGPALVAAYALPPWRARFNRLGLAPPDTPRFYLRRHAPSGHERRKNLGEQDRRTGQSFSLAAPARKLRDSWSIRLSRSNRLAARGWCYCRLYCTTRLSRGRTWQPNCVSTALHAWRRSRQGERLIGAGHVKVLTLRCYVTRRDTAVKVRCYRTSSLDVRD